LVGNPCLPSKKAPQIKEEKPVCPTCPKGYVEKQKKGECCPECVPTADIPDVCNVKNYGRQKLKQTTSTNGKCISLKSYKVTGCAGLCGSAMKATLGSDTLRPDCKCCQPTSVKKHSVTLECENGAKEQTTFYEIQSCSCQRTRCDSSFNMDEATKRSLLDEEDLKTKKSLLQSIGDMPETDDDNARRQRRSLLNDLALVHAKKKRK